MGILVRRDPDSDPFLHLRHVHARVEHVVRVGGVLADVRLRGTGESCTHARILMQTMVMT